MPFSPVQAMILRVSNWSDVTGNSYLSTSETVPVRRSQI